MFGSVNVNSLMKLDAYWNN